MVAGLEMEHSTGEEYNKISEGTQLGGRKVRIKDLANELTGFRGKLTRLHGFILRPFRINTINKP